MKAQRRIALLLVMFISIQLITLPVAFAEESTSTSPATRESSSNSVTVTNTFLSTEDAPTPSATITRDGKEYQLKDTAITKDESYEHPKKTFTHRLSSEVPLGGVDNLDAYFPASVVINESEYKGEIGRDPVTPYNVVERYETFRGQVDRSAVVHNLPDNDVSRIATSQVFEIASAAYPGATTQATLQLLDVSYVVAGTDHLGLPNNYTAYVTYRGQEEYQELHHYDVTANYSGEIASSVDQMTAASTYVLTPTPAPAPASTQATPTVIPERETPLAEPEFPLVPLAITGSVIVVLIAAPLLLFLFFSNARLIRVSEDDAKTAKSSRINKRKEQSALLCRRRLVLREGVAEFRIPPQTDIFDGATYCVVIKPYFARQEGMLEMTWQGKTVAVAPLSEHIDIDFKEYLITSVESALIESNLLD